MKIAKKTLIFAGASVAGAAVLTPLLTQLNFLQSFLAFSVFSTAENIFFASAIAIYALLSTVDTWRTQHKLVRAASSVALFIVAFNGFLVIGIASVALLWVIPMCIYQFSDEQTIAA